MCPAVDYLGHLPLFHRFALFDPLLAPLLAPIISAPSTQYQSFTVYVSCLPSFSLIRLVLLAHLVVLTLIAILDQGFHTALIPRVASSFRDVPLQSLYRHLHAAC